MSKLLSMMPVFALCLTFGLQAQAAETEVSASSPLRATHHLQQATTFVIENSMGETQVFEVAGETLTIEGKSQGATAVKVKYGEVEPGKYKITVEYPEGVSGVQGISMRGGTLSVDRIVTSGSVIISGGTIRVNGQTVNLGQGGAVSTGAPVHLRIGIPQSLLAHLKLESVSGNLKVAGAFHSAEEANRAVLLNSVSGEVSCEGICAMSGLTVETVSGDVVLKTIKTASGKIKTVSGDISLNSVDGSLSIKSTSGDVVSSKGAGGLDVQTVSGDVFVRGRTGGPVSAKTTSGDITFSNPDPDVREQASSKSGDISGLKKSVSDCEVSLSKKTETDPFKF